MSLSLDEAKAQLRVLHSEQDAYITLLIGAAQSSIQRYTGEGFDAEADDLKAAQLLLIEHLFYPDADIDLDPATDLPRAVVALAGPYRTPTLA